MLIATPDAPRTWSTRLRQIAASRGGRELALMLVVNLMITVFLVLLSATDSAIGTYKIANAIGFSIWGGFELLRRLTGGRLSVLARAWVAIPLGLFVGAKVAGWMGAQDLVSYVARDPSHQWRLLIGSLVLAVFATCFFVVYWRAATDRAELQSERRRAAEALQSEISAKLALLQAQIEPHFLFNTLANVQSAIGSDPKTAKLILEHLNQYLRATLGRTRRPAGTLADEIKVVSALLAISVLRLGDRLRYRITVPDGLETARLPPLLLQPLVENALKHGIEPAVGGGEVRVEARQKNDSLCLRVIDTGVGLDSGAPEGVGLANVRARLSSLYGNRGRLALYNREPHGVIAEIILPLEGI